MMHNLNFTRHAQARMRQRGFRRADIDFAFDVATCIGDCVFFLSDQDAAREIARRRREIQQLERLRGSRLVIDGDDVITVCHTTSKGQRVAGKKRGERYDA